MNEMKQYQTTNRTDIFYSFSHSFLLQFFFIFFFGYNLFAAKVQIKATERYRKSVSV